MFNTPRGGSSFAPSGLMSQSEGGFADPLAPASGYAEVDPWSGTQSPVRASTPHSASMSAPPNGAASYPALDAFVDDPPDAYIALFGQLEPNMEGQVTLPAIQRLLSSSQLPAATVEKIVSLTGRDRAAMGRSNFYRMLALVAFAQAQPNSEISLATVNDALPDLPLPTLRPPAPSSASTPNATQASRTHTRPPLTSNMSSNPGFSPWDTTPRDNLPAAPPLPTFNDANGSSTGNRGNGGNPEADAERGFWNRLETVQIELLPEKDGWFLQRYRLTSNKRAESILRRYSDFLWLHTTLLQRYPFRLLPALPPKRINPDHAFLEQRRKGLQRFLNAIVNHPVIRDDGALNVFMTEANFEAWRKRVKVSTEEESASKRLNTAQERAIPYDLEEKLDGLRTRLPNLIASYQKMVTLAERELLRRQMSAAEATRFALSLQTVSEDMPAACYLCVPGGKCCDTCEGTGRGLGSVGESWSRLAEQRDKEHVQLGEGIEALKSQRDLYTSFRDLFMRYDRLSRDSVETLQKKVLRAQAKVEALRQAQKQGWEAEVAKQVSAIDQDNSTIATLMMRRVFIRACMWHEMSVVLHSRQAAQATLGWRTWARNEGGAASAEAAVWERLGEELESMPLE